MHFSSTSDVSSVDIGGDEKAIGLSVDGATLETVYHGSSEIGQLVPRWAFARDIAVGPAKFIATRVVAEEGPQPIWTSARLGSA